jgi:hypothetical protein
MAKEIKGSARRKPPAPSASRSAIDDWLRRQMPDLQPIVRRVVDADPFSRVERAELRAPASTRRALRGRDQALPEAGPRTHDHQKPSRRAPASSG